MKEESKHDDISQVNTSPLLASKSQEHENQANCDRHVDHKQKSKTFWIKVVQTLALFYAFIAMGISGAIVGPTLMDIETLTNTNTDTVAWIMTARCLGGVLGVVIMGAIFTRANPWLLMGIANLVAGAMLMVTPLFRNIIVMCLFYVLHGVGRWFVDGGCNVMILAVWGLANGPWMQGLHCSAGIGSLLAPVVAAPFLSARHKDYDEEEIFSNGTLKVYLSDSDDNYNISSPLHDNLEDLSADTSQWYNGTNGEIAFSLFMAYFIVSMAVVFSAIAFFTLFLLRNRYKGIKVTNLPDDEYRKTSEIPEKKLPADESNICCFNIFNMSSERIYHMRMLMLVAFFDVIQCLVTVNYGNFVFTFAVKYLNWNKRQAVLVTSAYWGAFTSARVLAIFLSKFLHPRYLLMLCLLLGVASAGVLLFFAKFHSIVLWVCTIAYGMAMSPLFATSVSLLGRYIRVSSPEGATLVMSTIIGEMTGPVLVGALFNKLGPISLVYVMISVQCVLLVVSAIIYFSGRNKVELKDMDIQSISSTEKDPAEQELKGEAV